MTKQNKIIDHTIQMEGGYVDDPDDRGGTTNYGISLRYLKSVPFGDINKDGDIDAKDIKALDIDIARDLYKRSFWVDVYDSYINIYPKSVARLFDLGVNTGTKQSGKFLQRAINHCLDRPIKVDGICGRGTSAALASIYMDNLSSDEELHADIVGQADAFYRRIAKRYNNQKYLRGWLNRLNTRVL